jgi:hypothetical protein
MFQAVCFSLLLDWTERQSNRRNAPDGSLVVFQHSEQRLSYQQQRLP